MAASEDRYSRIKNQSNTAQLQQHWGWNSDILMFASVCFCVCHSVGVHVCVYVCVCVCVCDMLYVW